MTQKCDRCGNKMRFSYTNGARYGEARLYYECPHCGNKRTVCTKVAYRDSSGNLSVLK